MSSFKAAQDIRLQSVPKSSSDYELKLPENFQLPEGASWKWDDKSPYLAQAREIAHKQGRTQEEFSDMLGVYAAAKVQEAQEFDKLRKDQIDQLGPTGPARIDALVTWLKANGADDIPVQWWTAKAVKQFEKVIARITSQGASSFSQKHRDNETATKLNDEQWDKMSFAEKRDYASKNQQPARNGAAR